MTKTAIGRLTNEYTALGNIGKVQKAISSFVAETLMDFCNKSDTFAAAICAADSKSLTECLNFIAKGVKQSISDTEVARKAVKYYIPDADVTYTINIEMPGEIKSPKASGSTGSDRKVVSIFDVL